MYEEEEFFVSRFAFSANGADGRPMFGFDTFAEPIRLHNPEVSTLVQHTRTISYSIPSLSINSQRFLAKAESCTLGEAVS